MLFRGAPDAPPGQPGEFRRDCYSFSDITDEEVLTEPLYGCWEGNMSHAISRDPIDICRQRREEKVVLGNAGVVRVIRVGSQVTTVKEGDLAIMAPIGSTDRFGYVTKYLANETAFLKAIRAKTDDLGVSIFIDNIGRPVFRATLRALAREGVLATVGWKRGRELTINRAAECVSRHIHVFTHGASYAEGRAAMDYGEEHGWMPPVSDEIYGWDRVDVLANDYAADRVRTYFPLFEINTP